MDNNSMTVVLFADFDYTTAQHWLSLRRPLLFLLAFLYPLFVFSLQFLLNRFHYFSSLSVRCPLATWNAALALFSVLGFCRITPVLFGLIRSHGFIYTYTHQSILQTDPISGYWCFLWVLSKVPELLDTVFIVLRHKPLRFMHCILFGLVNFVGGNAYLAWVVWMNFFVHSLMYSYFFVSSLGIRPAKEIAQFITSLQLIQFFVILFQLGHISVLHFVLGKECAISCGGLAIGIFSTSIYIKLWLDFYHEQYLVGGKKTT